MCVCEGVGSRPGGTCWGASTQWVHWKIFPFNQSSRRQADHWCHGETLGWWCCIPLQPLLPYINQPWHLPGSRSTLARIEWLDDWSKTHSSSKGSGRGLSIRLPASCWGSRMHGTLPLLILTLHDVDVKPRDITFFFYYFITDDAFQLLYFSSRFISTVQSFEESDGIKLGKKKCRIAFSVRSNRF
jgi:hypothetical protein